MKKSHYERAQLREFLRAKALQKVTQKNPSFGVGVRL